MQTKNHQPANRNQNDDQVQAVANSFTQNNNNNSSETIENNNIVQDNDEKIVNTSSQIAQLNAQTGVDANNPIESYNDNSPRAMQLKAQMKSDNNSPRAMQLKAQMESDNNSPRAMQLKAQMESDNNSPRAMQLKAQMESDNNSPRAIQLKSMWNSVTQKQAIEEELVQQKQKNTNGLPLNLKTGIESLSGMDMSDVTVHENSGEPDKVNALATAQGKNIHLASGQEKHLSHEAWHVVQQMQGRVKPTMKTESGTQINDNPELEKEADVMVARAMQNNIVQQNKNNNLQNTNRQNRITQLTSIQKKDSTDEDNLQELIDGLSTIDSTSNTAEKTNNEQDDEYMELDDQWLMENISLFVTSTDVFTQLLLQDSHNENKIVIITVEQIKRIIKIDKEKYSGKYTEKIASQPELIKKLSEIEFNGIDKTDQYMEFILDEGIEKADIDIKIPIGKKIKIPLGTLFIYNGAWVDFSDYTCEYRAIGRGYQIADEDSKDRSFAMHRDGIIYADKIELSLATIEGYIDSVSAETKIVDDELETVITILFKNGKDYKKSICSIDLVKI